MFPVLTIVCGVHITSGEVLGEDGAPHTVFEMGERPVLRFGYEARERLANPNFVVWITRSDGVYCSCYSTEVEGIDTGEIYGDGTIELRLPPLKLVAEMYTVNVAVRRNGFNDLICNQTITTMHVRHDLLNSHFGVFHETASWKFLKGSATGASSARGA